MKTKTTMLGTVLQKLAAFVTLPLFGGKNKNENKPVDSNPPQSNQSSDKEINYCCHPRHNGTPIRRLFKTRGVSATGSDFIVWECSDQNCRAPEWQTRALAPLRPKARWLQTECFVNPAADRNPPR